MKSPRLWCALLCLFASPLVAAGTDKPRDLPSNYRDFQIYTTSQADPADPARIVMTVHMLNRGKRALRTRVRLAPKPAAGFEGG